MGFLGLGFSRVSQKYIRGRGEVAHAGHSDKIMGEVQRLVDSRGHPEYIIVWVNIVCYRLVQ